MLESGSLIRRLQLSYQDNRALSFFSLKPQRIRSRGKLALTRNESVFLERTHLRALSQCRRACRGNF